MMKLLIVHNIISPYKVELFNELADANTDTHVLFLAKNENYRSWKVDCESLKFRHSLLFDGDLESVPLLTSALQLWRKLEAESPDVLILGEYVHPLYWVGLIWAKLRDCSVGLWSSGMVGERPHPWFKESLKAVFVRNCEFGHVYSSRARDYLMKLGMKSRHITLLGNNTDNTFYTKAAVRHRPNREAIIADLGVGSRNLIYVGRFSPEKNVVGLLDAYHASVQQLPEGVEPWGLILVGDGPMEAEIRETISVYQFKRVVLTGFVQKAEMGRVLAAADVLILPSFSETWGLVVNEAMASGLAVVVSKACGCVPDLVKHEATGLVFDPKHPKQLVKMLVSIQTGETDITSLVTAAKSALVEFTPARMAGKILRSVRHELDLRSVRHELDRL